MFSFDVWICQSDKEAKISEEIGNEETLEKVKCCVKAFNLLWRMGFEQLHWVCMSRLRHRRLLISIAVHSTQSPILFASVHRYWDRSNSTAKSGLDTVQSAVSSELAAEVSVES